jgi:hypothetical protein
MITQILEGRGITPKRKTSKEWSSPCPFCGGEDRFCIWPEENRAQCIRGCGWKGDDIQMLRDLEGMSFQDAAEATGRQDKIKSQDKPPKKGKTPFVHPTMGKPDRIYKYTDETGKELFCVCRFEGKGKDGDKTFSQCSPDGMTWTVKGTRMVLYNLPAIKDSEYTYFVEGEKDVESLSKLNLPATTTPGGSSALEKLESEHSILAPLTGKSVFILPDNDSSGRKYAEMAARLLYGKAKEIRIVNLPDLPERGDVTDFVIKEGEHAKARLIEEIAITPVWSPPKSYFTLQDMLSIPDENHIPVIEGIMPHNSHILIAGESGVGKSILRLELTLRLAMGWDWLGFKIPKARSIAIFQYENSEHTEKFRIKKMLAGLGTSVEAVADRIKYAPREPRFNLTLKGDRVKLLEKVKALGCEVIVYDCLSNIHSSKENDNILMREVLDVLTDINAQLGTACIVIHHFGKPGENLGENAYRVRGASSIMDWAYTVITFTKKPHEEKVLRKVEFVKVRDAKEPKPFLIERDPETFLCRFYDEESLVSPAMVRGILENDFNGVVDKQRDLITAVMGKAQCSDRTAAAAIRRAVDFKQIYEINEGIGKRKGYRMPMTGA